MLRSTPCVLCCSFQDILQSPEYKSWEETMALVNVTGERGRLGTGLRLGNKTRSGRQALKGCRGPRHLTCGSGTH